VARLAVSIEISWILAMSREKKDRYNAAMLAFESTKRLQAMTATRNGLR
jgi:hypothetical protein